MSNLSFSPSWCHQGYLGLGKITLEKKKKISRSRQRAWSSPLLSFPSVQVWWVTRTTRTASLRMSKAAVMEELEHVELLLCFSSVWCPLPSSTLVLQNAPLYFHFALLNNAKPDGINENFFFDLTLDIDAVCVLVRCWNLFLNFLQSTLFCFALFSFLFLSEISLSCLFLILEFALCTYSID